MRLKKPLSLLSWSLLAMLLSVQNLYALAGVSFTKAFANSTIGPGSTTTLTFTIANASGAALNNLAFTDTFPAGMTVSAAPVVSTTCTDAVVTAAAGGSGVTFTMPRFADATNCSVSVNVTSSTVGVHTNTSGMLTYSEGTTPGATANLTVSATYPVFTKSFSPASLTPGQISTLTYVIDNTNGDVNLSALSFSDVLPAGLVVAPIPNADTNCSSYFAPVVSATAGGSSITLNTSTFSVVSPYYSLAFGASCWAKVDVIAQSAGNKESVTGQLTADNVIRGTAAATLSVTSPQLKKLIKMNPAAPGSVTLFEYTLTNISRSYTATAIGFTDDLNGALAGLAAGTPTANSCGGSVSGTSTLTLSGASLAPGASCTLSVPVSVPSGAAVGSYTTTTSAAMATVNGVSENWGTASDVLRVSAFPVITKTFQSDWVKPGGVATVEFNITNPSATDTMTNIAFTDDLSSFISGVWTGTPPGGVFCGGATGSISLIGDAYVFRMTGGSLAAGATCTFTVDLNVPADVANGTYTNSTGLVTATVGAESVTGPAATDTLTVIAAPSLSKTFVPKYVSAGDTIAVEYTLTHSLNAATDATGIGFTDDFDTALTGLAISSLPTGSVCGASSVLSGSGVLTLSGASLAPGESCSFTVNLAVPSGAAVGSYPSTTSAVTATVSGAAVTAAAVTDTLYVAGVTLSKAFSQPTISPDGGTVTLDFTVNNTSTVAASGISFTDSLSAFISGTTFTAATTADVCGAGSAIGGSGTNALSFTGGSLAANSSCTFPVTVTIPGNLTPGGSHSNITSALAATIGGTPMTLPAATATMAVSDPLQFDKSFLQSVAMPGDTVTLRFTLTNADTTAALANIAFTDDLDAALTGLVATGLPATVCGGSVSGTSTLTFSGGTLAADTNCSFDVSVVIPGSVALGGEVVNTTSSVSADIGATTLTVPPASANLHINNVLLSKSFTGYAIPGQTNRLNFSIQNIGTTALSQIAFSDDIGAAMTGMLATALPKNDVCGSGSLLAGSSVLTLTGASLAAGATCSFYVDVAIPGSVTPGDYNNTTSILTSAGIQIAKAASASVTATQLPQFGKVFASSSVLVNSPVTLTFTVDNSANTVAASSLAFTDNLPSGMVVATTPNASTTCTGGTLTAAAGTSVISYSGGTANAGASCTVQVDVVSATSAIYNNMTSPLTSNIGTSAAASNTLNVAILPTFSKAFASSVIQPSAATTLTFTIDNSTSAIAATSLAFTDNLPAGLTVASTPNASTTCSGGTLSAAAGATVISYSAGTVNAGSTCTISVDVMSPTSGNYLNVTSTLSSALGTSSNASASLIVATPPTFTKAFSPTIVEPNQTATLTFTIDNSINNVNATALSFTDNLPSGMTVASTPSASTTCTGGTLTATAGASVISYSGGTANAGTSCTVQVDVVNNSVGSYTNTTGTLSSSFGGGTTATSVLDVGLPPAFDLSYSPPSIIPDAITRLQFLIDNSGNSFPVSGLSFTQPLPQTPMRATGVIIASPANASTTCTGGTITAVAGDTSISYSGGTVAAGATCVVEVDVTASTLGDYQFAPATLTSSLDGNSTTSPAPGGLMIAYPVPTLSQWGMLLMMGLFIMASLLYIKQRRSL